MSAGKAIYGLLSNNTAVSNSVNGRIYPDTAPQKTARPTIIISTISTIPNNTLGLDGESSLDISRVQITIASNTRNQSNDIADLVRNVLKNVHNITSNSVNVNWCRFDSQTEFYDDFSSEEGLFITATDYKLSITK